jgi:hypothetical protein
MCPLNYGGTGDGCQPPNLITTLINIALAPGTVEEPMYKGQAGLQVQSIAHTSLLFTLSYNLHVQAVCTAVSA